MEFTQNDESKRDIINNIIILAKRGTYMVQAVIPKKCHKYPSTKILKHANVLAKVNKMPWGYLHNMAPHDAYSIPIHVRTVTLAEMSHRQKK